MKKFNVIFDNYSGNRYSYFVKAESPEEAINKVYYQFVECMNLHTFLYDICVKSVERR